MLSCTLLLSHSIAIYSLQVMDVRTVRWITGALRSVWVVSGGFAVRTCSLVHEDFIGSLLYHLVSFGDERCYFYVGEQVISVEYRQAGSSFVKLELNGQNRLLENSWWTIMDAYLLWKNAACLWVFVKWKDAALGVIFRMPIFVLYMTQTAGKQITGWRLLTRDATPRELRTAMAQGSIPAPIKCPCITYRTDSIGICLLNVRAFKMRFYIIRYHIIPRVMICLPYVC